MKYGQKIKVTKEVTCPGALMPAVGVEGKVIRRLDQQMIICEFEPPFNLAGGGKALKDPEHSRGVRAYFTDDEIEPVSDVEATGK